MAKRRTGCVGVVGLIAFAVAVLVGLEFGCRAVEAPWSIGVGGRPTLTGTWEGARRAQLGTEYRFYLALAYASASADADRFGRSDNLTGEARLCSPAGHVWTYPVTGRANRSGDAVTLDLWTPAEAPAMPAPGRVEAAWQGGDELTIRGGYNPLMPDGTFVASRVVGSDDPDDSFVQATLGRGDLASFGTRCQALQRTTP